MFINGILRNIEILMDQSATIASLSRYLTVLDKWSASIVSNERFANASDISAELQLACTVFLKLLVILQKQRFLLHTQNMYM